MEDSEKMSLAFSRTFTDNEGKIDEIVGKAKSKLETVDKKEVYAKLNDLSSMGDPIELIKGAIGQDNLDEANKYIDIIIFLIVFYGVFAPIGILSYLLCGKPKNKKKTPKK